MKTNPHKTSKFRGVSWKTQAQRWSVQLVVSDLHVHVGEFIDEIPAAKAYDTAALLAFGEDARAFINARVFGWKYEPVELRPTTVAQINEAKVAIEEDGNGPTLEYLEPDQCRWPIGRDDDDQIHFCGAARCAGSSYCEVHRNRSLLGGDVRYQWRGWHVRLSQK